MKVSRLFGQTLRQAPANCETKSHEFLVRGGFIRQLVSGVYSYLPLAVRSLEKIKTILREEMNRIGGSEVSLPVVHPADIWMKSGRWDAIDETLTRFTDRRGRNLVLAMTHEEVVASLASLEISSYKQLPQMIYQIQTKFRDELRSRGGLIRVREFEMKDSYSFDRDKSGLEKQYAAHLAAYQRIYARCGLPVVAVQGDSGIMGGGLSHEFMYISEMGEDSILFEEESGYAANRDVATFKKEIAYPGDPKSMERVHTPGIKTIEDLYHYLEIDSRQTAKVVFFAAEMAGYDQPRLIMALVRGDHEVNLIQLQKLIQANRLEPAESEFIRSSGAVPGFASPVGLDPEKLLIIVDDLVEISPNLTVGANEEDYHLRNVCCGRDFHPHFHGNIALAFEGAPHPISGKPMKIVRGVEVGNIFQLGTRYSEALEAWFLDEDGRRQPVVMGSYGIGVGRLFACVVEEYAGERGFSLPISIAPYHVCLVALGQSEAVSKAAQALYSNFWTNGIETLWDDRGARPGVMFADADLRGIPIRITISDRTLAGDEVEFKTGLGRDIEKVSLESILEKTQTTIRNMS